MADAILKVVGMPEEQWRAMSVASYNMSKQFDWDRSAEILEAALIDAVSRHRDA
jgi:hypothetical protein